MQRLIVRFTTCFSVFLLFVSCASSGRSPGNTDTSSPYQVPEISTSPRLSEKDKTLTKKIQENQRNERTPIQKNKLRSEILKYISTLQEEQIRKRLSGTGARLADQLKNNPLPVGMYGRWFRLRGTPVSTPKQSPYHGHLEVNMDVQEFIVENPFEFDDPNHKMYYVVVSLKPLPSDLSSSELILELDGLLWDTWDLSNNSTGLPDTIQREIPVFFVNNYRTVQ